MTDGITEAYHHSRILIQQYLEQFIAYGRYMQKPAESQVSNDCLLILSEEIGKMPVSYVSDVLNLKPNFCETVIDEFKSGQLITEELAFYLLFHCRKFSDIIRLQKVSLFSNNLIVYADMKWRIAENGVYYQTLNQFHDGDQDVLLGQAKHRYGSKLLREAPFVIFAARNYVKKRWRLDRVYQLVPKS